MPVAVHPESLPMRVTQSNSATVGSHAKLSTDHGAKTSFQTVLVTLDKNIVTASAALLFNSYCKVC